MIGRTCLERGRLAEVLERWRGKGPRGALIRWRGATLAVRLFRGLRRAG